jgi:hypothetical protein
MHVRYRRHKSNDAERDTKRLPWSESPFELLLVSEICEDGLVFGAKAAGRVGRSVGVVHLVRSYRHLVDACSD